MNLDTETHVSMCVGRVFSYCPSHLSHRKDFFVDNEDIPKRLTTEYVFETILIYIPYDIFFYKKQTNRENSGLVWSFCSKV